VTFDGVQAAAGGDFVDVPGRSQQIGLDWTRTFTSNFLNQVRYSYSRARSGFEGGAFPNCLQSNFAVCPPQIALDAGTDLGFGVASGFPQGRIINNSQVQDNATTVRGRHTLKFGGDYTRQRTPSVFLPSFAGVFEFDNLDALLANTPNFTEVAFGNPKLNFKENDLAFYFQDDWRIKDNLTLNLGLRWEWFQQAMNLLHDQTVAQQTGPNPFWSTALPLDRTTVPSVPQDLNNFSPVIGFAWTPKIFPALFW
jgi:outer membrane receptor protein involved in Fe transport